MHCVRFSRPCVFINITRIHKKVRTWLHMTVALNWWHCAYVLVSTVQAYWPNLLHIIEWLYTYCIPYSYLYKIRYSGHITRPHEHSRIGKKYLLFMKWKVCNYNIHNYMEEPEFDWIKEDFFSPITWMNRLVFWWIGWCFVIILLQ